VSRGALDDRELALVGAVDAQLRCGHRRREVGKQAGQGSPQLRQVAQQARGGEQGVIEAVPVAAEEHVPAHLAGQRGLELLHLLFDQGVAGLPHRRLQADAGELCREHFRALHVEDHGVTRAHAARQVAPQ